MDDPRPLDGELRKALRELVRVPVLLVASDYDGTLSPIVTDPMAARPVRESTAALRSMANLPDTPVAVISGRSLRDLAALSRLPEEVHLVGSHGSEFDVGFAEGLDPEVRGRLGRLVAGFQAIVDDIDGARLERKPASAALHYREVDPARHDEVLARAQDLAEDIGDVFTKSGKMVIEYVVVEHDKGSALDQLRHQLSAEAVLFVGDDVTDEDAFSRLRGPDVGIKVGDGDTAARYRVSDTDDVARVLAFLCEARSEWLSGHGAPPIERHTMLSNRRTVALMTQSARVTWMCHPRPDSPSVFAELLGGPTAGYFAVVPESGRDPIAHRYVADTLVAETRWPDLTVTDYLDRSDHGDAVNRLVRVLEGSANVVIDFAPRPDFGRAPAELEIRDDGVVVRGGTTAISLHAPGVTWEIVADGPHQRAVGRVRPGDDPVVCELRLGDDDLATHDRAEADRRRETAADWSSWASRLKLPSVASDAVLRSALTVKGLCFEPSGAVLAAATTSLPEELGGVRNWDYRFCWPRDAALSASALVGLGSVGEAISFVSWLLDRTRAVTHPDQLRPVYPLVGDDLIPEAVITTLSGYRGSRPVRVGNAAEHQVQLDIFGPIVDLIHRLGEYGLPVSDEAWRVVRAMVEAVSRSWREPDHGIWEERRPRRHHVHSKVMSWVAVDRAIRLAGGNGSRGSAPDDWFHLRDDISADVLSNGWSDQRGAFTTSYDDNDMDAAVLHIGLSGLLAPDDERFVSTVRAIERDLRSGPIVYRYRRDDGLPGFEGGFFICAFWLVEAYALIGELTEARDMFNRLVELVGPTGILPEQYDPTEEVALGNVPQAYSHLGLINAALALDKSGR